MKMTKTASYLKFRQITKSKEPIEITHLCHKSGEWEIQFNGFYSQITIHNHNLCNYSIELG